MTDRKSLRVRKGDRVKVIAGKSLGHVGNVLRTDPEKQKVWVEGANVQKRHQKPRNQQQTGGVIEKEASIDLSNVMIMCDRCNAPARIGGKRLEDGSSVRTCRRCGEAIDR